MCNETTPRSIISPHLLQYIAKNCDEDDKKYILRTLNHVNGLMKESAKQSLSRTKDICQTEKEKNN
ncbi:MAG: hypothetical protein LBI71_07720 [Enterobacteriaceae bacterium]|jgi:hypothetical protein|nr:hypothetical protein [Enterobacteriaceae bacterium]